MTSPTDYMHLGMWDASFEDRSELGALKLVQFTYRDTGRSFDLAQAVCEIHIQEAFDQSNDRRKI